METIDMTNVASVALATIAYCKIKVIIMRSGNNNSVQKGLSMALKKFNDRFDVSFISLGTMIYFSVRQML